VLRPKQEQLLQLLRARGSLSPREIWDGLAISKQGAMDLIGPAETFILRTNPLVSASSPS
jgi:hypothetical protein